MAGVGGGPGPGAAQRVVEVVCQPGEGWSEWAVQEGARPHTRVVRRLLPRAQERGPSGEWSLHAARVGVFIIIHF